MERWGLAVLFVVAVIAVPHVFVPDPSPEPVGTEVTTVKPVESVDTPTETTTQAERPQTSTTTPVSENESVAIVVRNFSTSGVENETLRNETLDAVEFLSDLPQNRTKRDRMVTQTATQICDAHNDVAAEVSANTSKLGSEGYRNTYRVSHTATALNDGLGANLDVEAIDSRMGTARKVSSGTERYAPIFGSYNRLHNASCAVKAGEPGSKEDFYVATAAFTTDVVLVKENVAYRASYAATGYASRQVGLMRLANTCGYKCVGLVQSEIHWAVRGSVHGGVGFIAEKQANGNLSIKEWNESTQTEVNRYLDNTSDTVIVNESVVTADQIGTCVQDSIDLETAGEYVWEYGTTFVEGVQTTVRSGEVPENISLNELAQLEEVRSCIESVPG